MDNEKILVKVIDKHTGLVNAVLSYREETDIYVVRSSKVNGLIFVKKMKSAKLMVKTIGSFTTCQIVNEPMVKNWFKESVKMGIF